VKTLDQGSKDVEQKTVENVDQQKDDPVEDDDDVDYKEPTDDYKNPAEPAVYPNESFNKSPTLKRVLWRAPMQLQPIQTFLPTSFYYP